MSNERAQHSHLDRAEAASASQYKCRQFVRPVVHRGSTFVGWGRSYNLQAFAGDVAVATFAENERQGVADVFDQHGHTRILTAYLMEACWNAMFAHV